MMRVLIIAVFAFGIVAATPSQASARDRRFRIEGNVSAISAADVEAVVAAVAPNPIYRLRVISHTRVHIETSAYRVENVVVNGHFQMRTVPYLVVDRVGRLWKVTGRETTALR